MKPLHVAVSGAGIGGLCLAQGLRKRGISVSVYEADPSACSRPQGYRLRIDEPGRAALAACSPDRLYQLAEATSNRLYIPRGVSYTHQLVEIDSHRPAGMSLVRSRAAMVVNRRTLRQVLLTGLGDAVCFNRTVTGYEETGDGVVVRFRDGAAVVADVLVIADGINSLARAQRLPGVKPLDTGLRGIYGHMTLDSEALGWIPGEILGGLRPVLGPERRLLALGVFQPRRPISEAVAEYMPEAELENVENYIKWTLIGPMSGFGVSEAELFTADPVRLNTLAASMVAGWHPVFRRIVDRSYRKDTFALSIRAVPVPPPWKPSRVTLLGDCVHATTPVGAVGANTALRDAFLLSRMLAEGAGGGDMVAAIGRYEEEMRGYAHTAVRESLRGTEIIFRADPSRPPNPGPASGPGAGSGSLVAG